MIYRYRPRYNAIINKDFMCDDGRYSYKDIPEYDISVNIHEYINDSILLVSPNSSLEELYTLQQIATKYNIPISGYSDSYVGNSDEWLILSDKSANRKSLQILDIDTSLEYINNQNKKYILAIDTIQDVPNKQILRITTKHFSKKDGTIINSDGIIQEYSSNIVSSELSLLELLAREFGTSKNRKEILSHIKDSIEYFKDTDFVGGK